MKFQNRFFAISTELWYLSQKITLMKTESIYDQVASWSEKIQAQGRYGFALTELKKSNKELSDDAVKFALKRLSDIEKVMFIFKGLMSW